MDFKNCLSCTKIFFKKSSTSRLDWSKQKYCSRICVVVVQRGKPLSEERKEQNRKWSTGRKHTPEAIFKMSGINCRLWKGGKPKCINCGKRVVNIYAKRCIKCYRKNNQGQNSAHWQGGITPLNTKFRNSNEYKLWRDSVFKRDNYTCQICNQYGIYLHADHIKPFAKYPELRFDVNNGRSLCVPCHYYITFKRKMSMDKSWGHFVVIKAVSA